MIQLQIKSCILHVNACEKYLFMLAPDFNGELGNVPWLLLLDVTFGSAVKLRAFRAPTPKAPPLDLTWLP
jgi:hypothetical protein